MPDIEIDWHPLLSMRVIGVFNYENRLNTTSELHHLMSYHFLRIKDEHTSLRLLYIVLCCEVDQIYTKNLILWSYLF